ncbi:MAG: hypothetical protein HKN70_01650, partial [Gammaproteobacteria bacterium]|nr:hypothetical protein [Gammaproteobacteria bacterium]
VVAPPRAGARTLPVELVKALLLAGASADFTFRNKKDILKYTFGRAGTAANGLDKRYGMGMLNVAASEQILTSEDSMTGFDYVSGIDDTATRKTGRYALSPLHDGRLTVSLVWLLQLHATKSGELEAHLVNYDLCIVETGEQDTVIAESVGADDTTENLRIDLQAGHHYELRLMSPAADSHSWPYALAWRYQRSE